MPSRKSSQKHVSVPCCSHEVLRIRRRLIVPLREASGHRITSTFSSFFDVEFRFWVTRSEMTNADAYCDLGWADCFQGFLGSYISELIHRSSACGFWMQPFKPGYLPNLLREFSSWHRPPISMVGTTIRYFRKARPFNFLLLTKVP